MPAHTCWNGLRHHWIVFALEGIALTLVMLIGQVAVHAASHREAPAITETPKVDATDFYMFRSYEPGREGFVTIIANYQPLQDPYGGPNYFTMDPDAHYYIHIDNNGDAVEDISFRFRFQNEIREFALPIGGQTIEIPIINTGPISPGDDFNLNVIETYEVDFILGDTRVASPNVLVVTETLTSSSTFTKPVDYIGEKSIPNYPTYADSFIYDINLPNASTTGRMFVGQRKDPFVVNLGETFDLINLNPVGPPDRGTDDLADKNVTSFILEIPSDFLTNDSEPVIGAWTTARLPRPGGLGLQGDVNGDGIVNGKDILAVAGNFLREEDPGPGGMKPNGEGPMVQVSRLGNPLVNELIIGLSDKDAFNCGHPSDDSAFEKYFDFPVLPQHLAFLFDVEAPTFSPRLDIFSTFMTGLVNLNAPQNIATLLPSEMLRLNTAIPPISADSQERLGAITGDLAGFPNGRRPGDDIVDIELRVMMGAVLNPDVAPSGQLPFTDGAIVDASFFDEAFPYLRTPLPGSVSAPPKRD